MKKTTLLMTAKRILFLFILLFAFSCKNEYGVEVPVAKQENDFTIETAKAWFEKTYLKGNKETGVDENWVRELYWKNAFESQFPDKRKLIVVPVKHHRKERPANGFTYLWIFKDVTGKENSRVVEYVALSKGENIQSKFSGLMLVRDWEGGFRNGFVYEKGVVKGLAESVDGENAISNRKSRSNSFTVCVNYYYYTCVPTGENGTYECSESAYNGSVCYYYPEGGYPYEVNEGEFGGGGGGGGSGEGLTPEQQMVLDYYNNGPDKPFNLSKLACFENAPSDPRYSYKVTLYADQPVYNSTLPLSIYGDVGHAFIGLERLDSQTNDTVRQSFGFYPESQVKLLIHNLTSPGTWGDNAESYYDVSITLNVTADQFRNGLNIMANIGSPTYNLSAMNCTHFALGFFSNFTNNLPNPLVYLVANGNIVAPSGAVQSVRSSPGAWGSSVQIGNNFRAPKNVNCP